MTKFLFLKNSRFDQLIDISGDDLSHRPLNNNYQGYIQRFFRAPSLLVACMKRWGGLRLESRRIPPEIQAEYKMSKRTWGGQDVPRGQRGGVRLDKEAESAWTKRWSPPGQYFCPGGHICIKSHDKIMTSLTFICVKVQNGCCWVWWVLLICERIIHYYTLTYLKQTEYMCTGKDKHLVLLDWYANLIDLLQLSQNLLSIIFSRWRLTAELWCGHRF